MKSQITFISSVSTFLLSPLEEMEESDYSTRMQKNTEPLGMEGQTENSSVKRNRAGH